MRKSGKMEKTSFSFYVEQRECGDFIAHSSAEPMFCLSGDTVDDLLAVLSSVLKSYIELYRS